MTNRHNMEVELLTYGAIIRSINLPMGNGDFKNVVLQYETLADYEADPFYVGALVGRVANRVANGTFTLNGKQYQVAQNAGNHHLHGGRRGFNRKVWQTEVLDEQTIRMRATAADGEEGYPGALQISVTYQLTDENQLKINYQASSSEDTPLNLTNHSYFNLEGTESKDCLLHEMKFHASQFTPTDEHSIPIGERALVADSPFDFSYFKQIGEEINANDPQLKSARGYDHNFVVNNYRRITGLVAEAKSSATNVQLKVYSDQPCFQFYVGNYLEGAFNQRQGFCIETQNYPDAINQANFPSGILKKGKSLIVKPFLISVFKND